MPRILCNLTLSQFSHTLCRLVCQYHLNSLFQQSTRQVQIVLLGMISSRQLGQPSL